MDLPEGIAGIPEKKGIASRFEAFLKKNNNVPGAKLLEQTYNYLLMQHAADPDSLVHEWARKHCRRPVSRARPHPSFYGNPCARLPFARDVRQPSSRGAYDLFATEGGTAAMCYIFDSLQENFLLNKGTASSSWFLPLPPILKSHNSAATSFE